VALAQKALLLLQVMAPAPALVVRGGRPCLAGAAFGGWKVGEFTSNRL
jgi:hypothetical protein